MMKKYKVDLLNNSKNSKNSMKYALLALSILVVISISPAFADTTQMSVTATLSGDQVHQQVTNADTGSLANRIFSVEPYEILGLENYRIDSTGKVSTYWDMSERPTGEYLFNTYNGENYAETTIFWNNTTTEIPTTPEPEIEPTTISVQTDKVTYTKGDKMIISGTASPVQEEDNRPDFVKDHSVNKVVMDIIKDGKIVGSKHIAIDKQGNYLYTTPGEFEHPDQNTNYTLRVTYLDKTVETNFSVVEPTPEPTPNDQSQTDLEERVIQLEAENQLLKEKIENLKSIILEQLKIIVEWINN